MVILNFKKVCLVCHKKYIPTKGRQNRQKYCSSKCNSTAWRERHPEKAILYSHEGWLKIKKTNPKFCRACGKKILLKNRTSSSIYCSKKCRRIKRHESSKKHYTKNILKFFKFKQSIGCQRCGYNKFGGALDFHHVDPATKERRIEMKHWRSNSKLIKKELKKCILLCANCHREEHFKLRHGGS